MCPFQDNLYPFSLQGSTNQKNQGFFIKMNPSCEYSHLKPIDYCQLTSFISQKQILCRPDVFSSSHPVLLGMLVFVLLLPTKKVFLPLTVQFSSQEGPQCTASAPSLEGQSALSCIFAAVVKRAVGYQGLIKQSADFAGRGVIYQLFLNTDEHRLYEKL